MTPKHPFLGLTPFHRPDARLASALARAGALGAVDLGRDVQRGLRATEDAVRQQPAGIGVRIHAGAVPAPGDLPDGVELVILPPGEDPGRWEGRTRFVRVTTLDEAVQAEASGADAVIVAGYEAGGRFGSQPTFVLLQRALARLSIPIWAQGGIGPHSAAACMAGGAAGIVLDAQLALVRESDLSEGVRRAVAGMDGTETVELAGFRVFDRPDLDVRTRFAGATEDEVAARLGGDDLVEQILPVGQDGAVAKDLADRFGTAAGVVRAFARSIGEALRQARETEPLAPGAPLARDLGLRYPVLQGPMTRVSDTSAFAAAVAEGGGLPFLALSLLRGDALSSLLDETRETLGDRPWGVGILGFAPPELRAEQLRAIEDARPPFAIIAGGRPSQARALEKLGTRTFLHVPSAGLLDLFLKEGATRFVFEGRECGGHVGPLTSMVLWDRQVARLLEHPRPEELSVVFAGGIHDGRSAAMIAALAAPLAARGARVGVLMGTAYLFTEEAVATGAVVRSYQDAVRACDETVLLETSPGHATRCTRSEYAEAFRAEAERLTAEGVEAKERWVRLEQMNLGRLRLASKGLRREGDDLVEVDDDARRREGMYMVGDVCTMRDALTTIEELHREVSEGSVRWLPEADGARVEVRSRESRPLDVAVVGMACVFPGAEDLDAYWYNIVHGIDSIREVPPERWDPDIYFDPDGAPGHTTPSKWGGFIDPIAFDPARYGIPPSSLIAIDPIQLLALEVSRRALEDAGYADRPFDRERTGVIFGAEGGTDLSKAYGFRALYPQYVGDLPPDLEQNLPAPTEDSFPGVLTNVIAGRIANRLDLGGENYTVNAACASSLASLSIAAQWLESGSEDMVLVGGADVHNSIGDFLMFSSVHALSKSGRCRTFDKDADGITLGEGVGVVVVKRLEDAERDGDRVYAILRGLGGSSDGKSLGLTAPRPEGQVRAYRRAYEVADVSPAELGLMEAHGTGTVVGDRTELATLDGLMKEAGAGPGVCGLGSVKSQIGHTKGAAGIASVIKAALAIHHRVLPPTIHVRQPNPYYDAETSPFTLSDRARPWVGDRRLAGVSAFGFGGTNYHAVLEEAPDGDRPGATTAPWPAELFLFRGADRDDALARAARVEALLDASPPWRLRDLARSASAGDAPVQVAIVARDADELRERIAAVRRGETPDEEQGVFMSGDAAAGSGKVAFLFPGQGSQYPGMLDQLFVAFPGLRDLLDHDREVARIMHPPRAFTPAELSLQQERLKATDVAQVALGMADLAMARLLAGLGVKADMLAGHSYGEMVALRVAGAWSDADLLELSRTRALAILEAAGDDPGAMLAAAGSPENLEPFLDGLDGVVPANQNAPDQTILSGPTPSIDEAARRLEAASVRVTRLPVACAFHSGVVAGARDTFHAALMETPTRPPSAEVWGNAHADRYPGDPDAVRGLLADQLRLPVLFARQIEAMYEAGARVFVEVGPGRVLSGLVDRVLGDRPHAAVPLDVKGEPGMIRLLSALGRLAVLGVDLDQEYLYEGRNAELFDLDAPPVRTHPPLTWLVDGHYARPLRGELPRGALRPVTDLPPLPERAAQAPRAASRATSPATPTPRVGRGPAGASMNGGSHAAHAPAAETDEAVVIEYLRNIRELAEAQRDVVMSYLGVAPGEARERVRPTRAQTPAALPAPPPRPAQAADPAPAAAPAPVQPETGPESEELDLAAVLIELVSERTGYPPEMLDVDLDLEADLSIDSIKRIEILGLLNERIGLVDHLGDEPDELLEELSSMKTLRRIQEWIEARIHTNGDGPSSNGHGDIATGLSGPLSRLRLVPRAAPLGDLHGIDLKGAVFAITPDDRGVAGELARRLAEQGATSRIVTAGEDPGRVDGLIHLEPLSEESGSSAVKSLFSLARSVGGRPTRWVVSATGPGGIPGLLKSLAKELGDGLVRSVGVDADEPADVVAGRIIDELGQPGGPVEIVYQNGERRSLEIEPAPLLNGTPPRIELDRDAVVLVTGGARGITARVSIELARRFGCRLELLGRSDAAAGPESADTAGVDGLADLRRRLAELHGDWAPPAVDAEARRILAEREIRRTLDEIRRAGGTARYHAVDVRDENAFGALLARLYAEHGRLDGVVHGAGTIEDKLLRQKSAESFDRVFDTKVHGALTLARALREDVRFVVFFSSVAGVLGNRGQTDYAAANDLLDRLAEDLDARVEGRVVSVAWGPWDETGMVSPELRREYERRGIGLITPDLGVRALMDELAYGPKGESNVVIMGPTSTARR